MPGDSRPDLLEALARGSGLNFVGRGIGQTAQLLAQILIARIFGPAAFGLFGLGWTVFRLLSFLAPLGVEHGVVRFGSRYVHSQPASVWVIARQSAAIALISGAAFGVLIFLVSPFLAAVVNEPDFLPIMRAFAFGLPLVALMRVGVATTRVSQRMRYSVLSEYLLQPLSFLLLVVTLYLMGTGVVSVAWAASCSFGLAAILAWYLSAKLFAGRPRKAPRSTVAPSRMLWFSVPVALASSAAAAMPWLDRMILAYFVPARDLGIYHAASQVSLTLTLITTAVGAVLGPLVADLHSRERMDELNQVISVAVRWSLYLALVPGIILLIAPEAVLAILFGSDFVVGRSALMVLVLGQIVVVATGTPGFMLVMVGRQGVWLRLSLLGLALNIVLNVMLIPRFGLLGAAAATALSLAAFHVPSVLVLRKQIGLWPYSLATLWVIVPGVVSLLGIGMIQSLTSWRPIMTIVVSALLAAGVLAGFLVAFPPVAEDRRIVRGLVSWARSATASTGENTEGTK